VYSSKQRDVSMLGSDAKEKRMMSRNDGLTYQQDFDTLQYSCHKDFLVVEGVRDT